MNMNLHAPSMPMFMVSLVLAVLALLGYFVTIPYITLYGFLLAMILSITTFFTVRSFLENQRVKASTRQTIFGVLFAREFLQQDRGNAEDVVSLLQTRCKADRDAGTLRHLNDRTRDRAAETDHGQAPHQPFDGIKAQQSASSRSGRHRDLLIRWNSERIMRRCLAG